MRGLMTRRLRMSTESRLGISGTVLPPASSGIAPATGDRTVIGGPLRILVVDDNQINREVAAGILQRAGHVVTVAGDGGQAVQLVSDQDLDLVLMDVQMPTVDGLTATRRIRALSGPRGRIPVIALTAHASERSRRDCIAAGMDGFLTKPLRLKALFTEIAAAIATRRTPADPIATEAGDEMPATGSSETKGAAPNPGDDLLDREQIAMMEDALGVDDWRVSLGGFADAARGELRRLTVAIENGDDYKRPAHTLKGMAWNVGARRLGEMALALETHMIADERAHLAGMYQVLDLTLRAMGLP